MFPSGLARAFGAMAVCCASLSAGADVLTLRAVGGGTVTALSADGSVAVGEANGSFEAFRWTEADGLVRLGRGVWRKLRHRSGIPSVSADGQAVAFTILSDDGTSSTAGRWTSAGGWQTLQPVPADGGLMDGEDSSVFGLSGDGQVPVGLYWRPGATGGSAHAMQWSPAGGMVDLGSSGGSSRGNDASADGRVVVGFDEHPDFGNRRAAVWVDGVKTVLEDGDWPSEASAVSADGSVVVGQGIDPDNEYQVSAVMWRRDAAGWTRTVLGVVKSPLALAGGFAFATGVSDDGSMVVGINRPDQLSPKSFGFVWTTKTGFMDVTDWMKLNGLRPPALQKIYTVSAISGDGRTLAALAQNRKTGRFGTLLIHREP